MIFLSFMLLIFIVLIIIMYIQNWKELMVICEYKDWVLNSPLCYNEQMDNLNDYLKGLQKHPHKKKK